MTYDEDPYAGVDFDRQQGNPQTRRPNQQRNDQQGQQRRTRADGPGENYVEVKERLQTFYATYPTGAVVTDKITPFPEGVIDGLARVMVEAKAYRTPDDPHPGTGSAWMVLPGKTPYTNGSELENTETSAWGRAIAAVGILVDRGISSAQEVRNKAGGEIEPPSMPGATQLRDAAAKAAGESEPTGDGPAGAPEPVSVPPPPAPAPVAVQPVLPTPGGQPPVEAVADPQPDARTEAALAESNGTEAQASIDAAADGDRVPDADGVVESGGSMLVDYEEFKRLAREHFLPNAHIANVARDLVEKGKLRSVGGVRELTDEERGFLLQVAILSGDENKAKS